MCFILSELAKNSFVNIEHDLVRAYFEANGFLIRIISSTQDDALKKKPLLPLFDAFNPSASADKIVGLSFRLFTGDLLKIRKAAVRLLGWQNSSFNYGLLNSDSRLLKFFRKELDIERFHLAPTQKAELKESYENELQHLLIVPALPKLESKCVEFFEILKSLNIHGVLTMSSVLENLLRKTLDHSSAGNSVFHLLKLLKAYGLANEPQLDIFEK